MKKKTLISIFASIIALILVIIVTCVTVKQVEQPKDVTTATMEFQGVAVGVTFTTELATL